MKVLFLIPSLVAGGAERILTHMANYWADQSHHISIAVLDHAQCLPFYPLHRCVELIPLGLLRPKRRGIFKLVHLAKQLAVVRRQVRESRPDVVIAFLDITIFLSLASTISFPVSVVVSERNNPYRNVTNPWLQRSTNWLYQFADAIVLQTHRIATTFPLTLRSKISVIANPVPTPHWWVTNYAKQLEKKNLVAIGRLTNQKGFDILIKSFARTVHRHPGWQLQIAGVGEEQAALHQLCKNLSIAEQVVFLGRKSDLQIVWREASLFVLPSRFEGFPNALCEAMAVGLPVIATRCEFGPEEIVRHGENGLLVPVEDVNALSEALDTLINNPELCQRLGTQARTVTDTFSVEKIMQQWNAVIHAL